MVKNSKTTSQTETVDQREGLKKSKKRTPAFKVGPTKSTRVKNRRGKVSWNVGPRSEYALQRFLQFAVKYVTNPPPLSPAYSLLPNLHSLSLSRLLNSINTWRKCKLRIRATVYFRRIHSLKSSVLRWVFNYVYCINNLILYFLWKIFDIYLFHAFLDISESSSVYDFLYLKPILKWILKQKKKSIFSSDHGFINWRNMGNLRKWGTW